MPASSGSTDAGSGMGLPPPPPPPKATERPDAWSTDEAGAAWANPAVVGLMGFGTTTMIAGLSNLPQPYVSGFLGNWVVYGMAIAFGGLAQFIAGLIALRKGNLFAGSAFVGYGAFWLAYSYILQNSVAMAASPAPAWGVAGFAFIWMMFTFTFLINAPKHGWGITLVFLTLFISFILLVIKFTSLASDPTGSPFLGSGGDNWAVGGMIIVTGAIAWYVATAVLTNWNYGRTLLPE